MATIPTAGLGIGSVEEADGSRAVRTLPAVRAAAGLVMGRGAMVPRLLARQDQV
jgi:hypothetical protein